MTTNVAGRLASPLTEELGLNASSRDLMSRLRRGVYGTEGVRRERGGALRLIHDAAGEIQRLRGQRHVLAELLEKATAVLYDLRIESDDNDTRRCLGDLISWSDQAVRDARREAAFEA